MKKKQQQLQPENHYSESNMYKVKIVANSNGKLKFRDKILLAYDCVVWIVAATFAWKSSWSIFPVKTIFTL